MGFRFRQFRGLLDLDHLAIDAGPDQAGSADRLEGVGVLALATSHDGAQDNHFSTFLERQDRFDDLLGRLPADRPFASGAVGQADPSEQEAEVIGDLRHRRDRPSRVGRTRLLIDGDGGRETLDRVHVGRFELVQELAGIAREALDEPALALGVDGVEGQGALARARDAGEHDQPVAGDVDVDIPEVMHRAPRTRIADSESLIRPISPVPIASDGQPDQTIGNREDAARRVEHGPTTDQGTLRVRIELKLFAIARQKVGSESVALDLPEPVRVSDLRRAIGEQVPGLAGLASSLMISVDAEYARDETVSHLEPRSPPSRPSAEALI